MAELIFRGDKYIVDHAVKGPDYIHGYGYDGGIVVAFDGVSNFEDFDYDDAYMSPEDCPDEACNGVRHVDGKLIRGDGAPLGRVALSADARAIGDNSIAAGARILKAQSIYDGNPDMAPESEWRYPEAIGSASEANGMGAVAYSRASKSLGYRTQTGYPPSAAYAKERPDAIVKQDEEGNKSYPDENEGQAAFAIGADTIAAGNHSFAGGFKAMAYSNNSFAFGNTVLAKGYASIAMGREIQAHGENSVAMGYDVQTHGNYSVAMGNGSRANGNYSVAM